MPPSPQNLALRRLNAAAPGFEAEFAGLLAVKRETAADVGAQVAEIIARVRGEGDAALLALTERFDGHRPAPGQLRVGAAAIEGAVAAVPPETLAALKTAITRITDYHRRQKPEDLWYRDAAGVGLGHRWTAVAAAGLYVPGGLAAYPSSLLMNAIPAQVAGVARLVVAVPAPGGVVSPLVLAAAQLLGIDEIYPIGGAQAIAALAYGTESIQPVDKLVGPGNAFVAAAKRQVFGQVGIDMIAGPSEILVLADGANDPRWIALDLLSQAEHDPASQAILITDDAAFADAVAAAVAAALEELPRAEIARASWLDHGAIIEVARLEEAIPLIDRFAPEHLELAIEGPRAFAESIRNAGSIFLGRYTPEAIGDYMAGPNHVLPTARSARFSSGLSVLDFMKRSSLISCDAASLQVIGPAAACLAEAEGLDAHAASLRLRLAEHPKP